MTRDAKKRAETASTVALFAVILVVSVTLAMATDLNVIVRALIAIVLGIIAAAVTFILVGRRR